MDGHKFKKGDLVRENRMGSPIARVVRVEGTTLYTTREGEVQGMLHVTKAVLADRSAWGCRKCGHVSAGPTTRCPRCGEQKIVKFDIDE